LEHQQEKTVHAIDRSAKLRNRGIKSTPCSSAKLESHAGAQKRYGTGLYFLILNTLIMNVVVPIDFSNHSKEAAVYAASLVKAQGGNLHLVHVLVPMEEEPDYLPVQTIQAKYNTVSEMYFLQESIRRQQDVRTSCDLVPGDIATQIIRAARRVKADLIVMGTQGNSGLRKHLYGSHTAAVMQHSSVPVLTLPEGSAFKPFQRMVYATDYNYSNINDIREIASFAKSFDAVISLIHINKRRAPWSKETMREDFEELIHANVDYPYISFEEYDNTDTAEGLRMLLQERHADLLIVPNRRKSLVEKITGRSVNEDFTFDLDIPLLVF
jgi:nucleotide-binding universal stress UspA family protein